VIDSTRLIERLGDARAAELWVAHDRKSRELLAHYNVREINRTDGFVLVFDRTADAASFALAYHAILAGLGMEARAGLHCGPVTLRAARNVSRSKVSRRRSLPA
jgi:class 3 adenylate cyclase